MTDVNTQNQINEINRKLDLILAEIELQQRHRREMEDLKDDLMRVGKDLYETAVTELEEVHDQVDTKDIFHLGKKLLRNMNNMNRMFDQLESARDFLDDISPLARESMIDFMNKLDEMDRKGYFNFFSELKNMTDNIVTSFSKEDVKALGDNIVTILNTIKSLTQPDILNTVNNAVSVYKNLDVKLNGEVSIYKLIKELNTPEVKRGLAFAIEFLKNIAETKEKKSLTKIDQLQSN